MEPRKESLLFFLSHFHCVQAMVEFGAVCYLLERKRGIVKHSFMRLSGGESMCFSPSSHAMQLMAFSEEASEREAWLGLI
jgi:hypothetical protein